MTEPSIPVVLAALRGLTQRSAEDLERRMHAVGDLNAFQQRVLEEVQRLDLTRLMWLRADRVTDIEIWRRRKWRRLTPQEARDLLLDRYREIGLHDQVEAWIKNHPETRGTD